MPGAAGPVARLLCARPARRYQGPLFTGLLHLSPAALCCSTSALAGSGAHRPAASLVRAALAFRLQACSLSQRSCESQGWSAFYPAQRPSQALPPALHASQAAVRLCGDRAQGRPAANLGWNLPPCVGRQLRELHPCSRCGEIVPHTPLMLPHSLLFQTPNHSLPSQVRACALALLRSERRRLAGADSAAAAADAIRNAGEAPSALHSSGLRTHLSNLLLGLQETAWTTRACCCVRRSRAVAH